MAMMRALVYDGSIVVLVVDVEHGVMGLAGWRPVAGWQC